MQSPKAKKSRSSGPAIYRAILLLRAGRLFAGDAGGRLHRRVGTKNAGLVDAQGEPQTSAWCAAWVYAVFSNI